MIVVDSSVWIDLIRDRDVSHVVRLRQIHPNRILIGDLVLAEVLQGARSDAHAARLLLDFRRFPIVSVLDAELAPLVARNFRILRGLGITIRKTTDLIIGTFCIENDHELLQNDRDFIPMEEHLGLRLA
jgi:predicted nucleic acid-binding protein